VAGLSRSLLTYYGPWLWRGRRMEKFYRQFVARGDLAFDIGSHVGDRVAVFRRIGARVVAVEPQPDFVATLRLLYGRDRSVEIEAAGVAATSGAGRMRLSTRTPTVSSFADSWIHDVRADPTFSRVVWDREIIVPTVTLEVLMARFGQPRFCKIDVEGYESEVVAGLSHPIDSLSFEYIPIAAERAVATVKRLKELGDYRYRRSRLEAFHWSDADWLTGPAMIKVLRELPACDRPGDIYAVRSDQLSGLHQV
jgi:FkbM family methyltransferase